jgi:ATP-dependent Lon protease
MEVVLPERNRKDLTEMPKELLEDLKLHFVRHIDEVLKLVMTRSPYIVTRTRATKPHGARVSRTV